MLSVLLIVVQLGSAVLLILFVLLQQQGAGLGAGFGGGAGMQVTRRGADKFLFRSTIVLATLLFLSSILIVAI